MKDIMEQVDFCLVASTLCVSIIICPSKMKLPLQIHSLLGHHLKNSECSSPDPLSIGRWKYSNIVPVVLSSPDSVAIQYNFTKEIRRLITLQEGFQEVNKTLVSTTIKY